MFFGSSGVSGFIRACSGGRWVHSGASCGRRRWVQLRAPWMLFCSSGIVGLTSTQPVGNPGSLGPLTRALGFTLASPWGRWVHPSLPWGSLHPLFVSLVCFLGCLVSFRVVAFTRLHPGGHWIDSGYLRPLGCAQVVAGFIRGRCFHSDTPCWSLVYPRSLLSFGYALMVAGLIWL